MNDYIPGVCNIGKKEQKARMNIALVAFAISLIYLMLIIIFSTVSVVKLFIFVPIFISTVSYLQYKMHFCAEFGILGKYNFTEKIGNTLSVESIEYLKLDRVKALKILSYSLLFSVASTLLVLVLF